ncbi:MAG: hypothetical protein ABIL09_04155 [Gemmatimonadota bacterium]
MADALESMLAREVDFRLEVTDNAYAACRALSIRARHINRRFHDLAESAEVEQPSPTVGAMADYSRGRIAIADPRRPAAGGDDTRPSA